MNNKNNNSNNKTTTLKALLMLSIVSIILVPALTNSAFASQELVINGSFEEPVLPSSSISVISSITGWTPTIGTLIELRNNYVGTASDGDQFVELDVYINSGITQTLGTSASSKYLLSFDYSPRIYQPASTNNIEVYWDGVLIADATDTGSSSNNWTTYVFDVVSSENSTVLEFRAAGTSDSLGGNLDNVSVTLIISPELFCGQPESYYNVINGTSFVDYLVGTNSPDLILGNGGNDFIKTQGANNCIYAGDDSIQLKGTSIAYGEDGDDTIYIINPSIGHLIDGGNDSDLCVSNARQPINTIHCEIGDAFPDETSFITTWSIDESDKSLEIPTEGTGYNYTIDWGDGTTLDVQQTGNAFHTYTDAGSYTVSISGDFPRIYMSGSSSAEKLISIDQWGDIEWTSMEGAFSDTVNMNVIASDVPDLSGVKNMGLMFFNAGSFNGDISEWDVSSVTDMSNIFEDAGSFNGDVSGWDVSSVTDMEQMFFNAGSFNSDISEWDVSSVTNMHSMFHKATSFNGDVSKWNVSSVTMMFQMFSFVDSFNSDISNWDVSRSTHMGYMFYKATSFNGDISNWDVSSVTNMGYMFSDADSFNGDISGWDVSSVTTMSHMFYLTDSFNGDISGWDVSSVTNMYNMLKNTPLSTSNYDKLLDTWSKLPTLQNNVSFTSSSKYCDAGEIGRSILIDTYGWSITDTGKDTIENCNLI